MHNPEVGVILDLEAPRKPERDAIHVAIAPVIAMDELRPGTPISVVQETGEAFESPTAIGVVDPFLKQNVREGETFWIFLNPNTVTSLRHAWTHPSFQEEGYGKKASKEWIAGFAVRIHQTYDSIMAAAAEYQNTGDWTYDNTQRYGNVRYELWNVFWDHWQIVTGQVARDRSCFFTCAC